MKGPRKTIGLLGCGVIGERVGRAAETLGFADVAFLHARHRDKALERFPKARYVERVEDVAKQEVDLVVEAATSDVMRAVVLDVLDRCDMIAFSLTALADDDLRAAVSRRCAEAGTRLYIPHGGILGLDGISDGRSALEEVTITTTKSPKSLGSGDPNRVGVLYDGPTRGACAEFPRNVNVHACLALCGLGFDRTRSVIIGDPEARTMGHVIEVKGKGLQWRIEIASPAVGAVTGAYTPVSAVNTVRRVLTDSYDIVLA
jgi:aspartate dehydrogenase